MKKEDVKAIAQSQINLIRGDCLKEMFDIPNKSIDMVCCDMPYGTTSCKWDRILPLDMLWQHYKRICKENAAIVLFAGQPFTSILINSNLKQFKYTWVWDKRIASNSQLVKHQPLKIHEDIVVFGERIKYFPQGIERCNILKSNKNRGGGVGHTPSPKNRKTFIQTKTGYPKSIINFKPHNISRQHPTQKPVALIEYLIKTYTNEGDTVLDHCMGAGTTGVACKNLNREFIGIELDEKYFEIAKKRIEGAQ